MRTAAYDRLWASWRTDLSPGGIPGICSFLVSMARFPDRLHGPFAESREFLGGYQIIDVPDLDAALDWAARCPGAKYGRVEVRPLAEF